MKLKKLTALFMSCVLIFSMVGCGNQQTADTISATDTIIEEAATEQNSIQTDEEGGGVRLEDDYYDYINGGVLAQNEIPSTKAYWSWDEDLGTVIEDELSEYIDELINSTEIYEKGTAQQRIKDLYECYADTDNRNEVGIAPLQEDIDAIRNAVDIDEYIQAVSTVNRKYGTNIIAPAALDIDSSDSNQYIYAIGLTSTFIGKAYMEGGEDTQIYVDYYFDYVKAVLEEYGIDEEEASKSIDDIRSLVKEICAASLSTEEYYDPGNTYNLFTEESLQELYTNIDVPKMLKTLGISGRSQYEVWDVGQAKAVNSLLVEENLPTLKDYATYIILATYGDYANTEYEKLSQDVMTKLYGVQPDTDEKEWKEAVESFLEWDFAELYVKDNFTQEDKQAVENMVYDVINIYYDIIDRQEWMSDATKEKAKRKLETMNVKIGYPDEWPETRDLWDIVAVADGGNLLTNILTYAQNESEYYLAKIDEKVDKSEWDMTPQTVNAYYEPANNEIVLPAAILRAPYYDSSYTYMQNLGGTGWTIGHELSHAFDSSGCLYDEYGNYNIWWTDEEMDKYDEFCQSIVEYYDNYELSGKNINGELTLGENIADLAAMECIAAIAGDDEEGLDEAFRQAVYTFAIKYNDEYLTNLIKNDTHSPYKIRMNATLSSCDAFYKIYDIKEGDGMYVAPEDRVGIWK